MGILQKESMAGCKLKKSRRLNFRLYEKFSFRLFVNLKSHAAFCRCPRTRSDDTKGFHICFLGFCRSPIFQQTYKDGIIFCCNTFYLNCLAIRSCISRPAACCKSDISRFTIYTVDSFVCGIDIVCSKGIPFLRIDCFICNTGSPIGIRCDLIFPCAIIHGIFIIRF